MKKKSEPKDFKKILLVVLVVFIIMVPIFYLLPPAGRSLSKLYMEYNLRCIQRTCSESNNRLFAFTIVLIIDSLILLVFSLLCALFFKNFKIKRNHLNYVFILLFLGTILNFYSMWVDINEYISAHINDDPSYHYVSWQHIPAKSFLVQFLGTIGFFMVFSAAAILFYYKIKTSSGPKGLSEHL